MRDQIGRFTSFKSYWAKNRKRWYILLITTLVVASNVAVWGLQTWNDIYSNYDLTTPTAEAEGLTAELDTSFCSLPYVECDLEKMEIKDWVWRRLNQNLGYDEAVKGMAIIECESKWNPDTISKLNSNGSIDRGLWQINSIHTDISNTQSLDYMHATDWAINKYWQRGWQPWVCAGLLGIK